MPIYEFECGSCRKSFQTYTPTMKWDHVRCPKCGSIKVDKLLSRFAVGAADGKGDFDSDSNSAGECSGDPGNCQKCDFDD